MSKTMTVAPIMGALLKSEEILGKGRVWHGINPSQYIFLEQFFTQRAALAKFSDKELLSWVSWIAEELNKILKDEGFDIQIGDFAYDEFGVVSILDVLVEWLAPGQVDFILSGSAKYPAVKMEPRAYVDGKPEILFEALNSYLHPHSVAVVKTQSDDKVYMTVAEKPAADFDLTNKIDEIRDSLHEGPDYDWLKFPMVDLNHQIDIGWLKGMWTTTTRKNIGQKAIISQALQQTKFKMNQFGARVKSAVAIGVRTVSIRIEQGFIINKPFFLWIEREGATIPVMYAYIDREDWKNPGNLSNI